MRLKASLLVTASGMTLVLVMVGLLHSTSQQANDVEPADALSLVTPSLGPTPSQSPSQSPSQTPAKATAAVDNALFDRPNHPDRDTKESLNRRFSVDESLDRVKQIDQMLAHFRTATAKKQFQPGNQPIIASRRIAPGTQGQAHSWTGAVTGTLKKQEYEIKKLELALAQKQFKDGEIPKTTLVQKQADYQKAAREFKSFLNSSRMAD